LAKKKGGLPMNALTIFIAVLALLLVNKLKEIKFR
jgi:hypothetical protein